MLRKFVFINAIIIFCICVTCLIASSDEGVKSVKPLQKEVQSPQLNSETSQDAPDWLKRTNFAIVVGTDQKPTYFLETIQPLLGTQSKDIVFFNQSRISDTDQRPTYNIGLGARKIFKENYLFGINSFYDYQDLHKHSRGGVGFDILSDRGLEARMNSYIAISGERLVWEDAANFYYEEVANGFDGELGAPLPYLPFLKLYGGGYWYNFDHFKNKYGWKGRLEFTPLKYSRINFEMFDDTKRKDLGYRFEGALTLAFTSFSLKDIIGDIKGAKEAYPKIKLEDRALDRAVRDFDITVIKKTTTRGGLTVEGGRSG